MAGALAQQPGLSLWFPRSAGNTLGRSTVSTHEVDPLVAKVQKGDRAAFQQLFAELAPMSLDWCTECSAPQSISMTSFKCFCQYISIGDFRVDSKLSTWLHRITVNVVLMTRRAARCRPVYSAEITEDTPHLLPVDSGLAPDEDAHRRERIRAFQHDRIEAGEKKRTVFVLHELRGIG
ncbi:MAG: hypothetical protein U0165_16360 [Polyangiaceae bacterium]